MNDPNDPNHPPPVPIIFGLNNTQTIPITGKNINVGFDGTDNNIRINIRIDNNNNNITIPIPIHDNTTLKENSDELSELPELSKEEGRIPKYMMIRTICDIIKDATNARIIVPRKDVLIPLLNQLFPPKFVTIAAEPARLEEIKAISNDKSNRFMSGRVFIKSAYTDHIPLPVTHVFNESGAEPDTFSPIGATIMSSFASVADPATRKVPTSSYPGENYTLHFDQTFMSGLVGFLEQTTWWAMQIGVFRPDNNTQYKFEINVGANSDVTGGIVSNNDNDNDNVVTNNTIAKNKFSGGYYFQGNPTKNKFINKNPGNLSEILRYMIIKEMGDMMQVYVMLVWYVIIMENNKNNKNKFVMSTTDLVVMNTCQLFQMPCLYTNQGKDSSMLSGQEKIDFDDIFKKKMDSKGTEIYKNWKKNNKFANTLYYLPFEESSELKNRRRLNTIYYVIKTQNQKQLDTFDKAKVNLNNLRYIKMGRLGPLMTSFSNDIMTEIIPRIIQNIEVINHNLLVRYNELIRDNNYTGEETDIELKKLFSLHILITRQKYPPTFGNTYVYVIQNLTHYTEELPIGDGTSKLVDMILDNNIDKFKTVDITGGVTTNPELNIPENPKVSNDPGPNEKWLIYSIANWFKGVRNNLYNSFGWIFEPIVDYSSNLSLVGGMVEEEEEENTSINNFGQSYEKIGFVTLIPCIYEQLCSIYEKHNIVYGNVYGNTESKYGEIFVENFILNLTRYQTNKNIPTLISPYNNIVDVGRDDKPIPYSFNLIYSIPDMEDSKSHHNKYLPYEECVIHTDDIDFDIKNIHDSDVEFKEELIAELEKKKIELIANNNNIRDNVFTVDDNFAQALFKKSGITFNEPQEQLTTPINGSPQATAVATPISSQKDLEAYLSPENEMNRQKLFDLIITPLKEKQIPQLENIMLDNIDLNSGLLFEILDQIKSDIKNKLQLDDDLKETIINFMNTRKIENIRQRGETLDFDETPPLFIISVSDDEKSEMDGTTGGKFIKNKKTRRRNKRSHKKHHKTNKRHKKHKKSCKNKTRKTKKAKRKNKTV